MGKRRIDHDDIGDTTRSAPVAPIAPVRAAMTKRRRVDHDDTDGAASSASIQAATIKHDTKHDTKHDIQSVQEQKPSFLGIPTELRVQIYEDYFGERGTRYLRWDGKCVWRLSALDWRTSQRTKEKSSNAAFRLLLVNKQVHSEAKKCFIKAGLIAISVQRRPQQERLRPPLAQNVAYKLIIFDFPRLRDQVIGIEIWIQGQQGELDAVEALFKQLHHCADSPALVISVNGRGSFEERVERTYGVANTSQSNISGFRQLLRIFRGLQFQGKVSMIMRKLGLRKEQREALVEAAHGVAWG
jgi:hypothetical protein